MNEMKTLYNFCNVLNVYCIDGKYDELTEIVTKQSVFCKKKEGKCLS